MDMESIDQEAVLKSKKLIPFYVYENLGKELDEKRIEAPYLKEILTVLETVHSNMPPPFSVKA